MCPIINVFGFHISSFLLFNFLGFFAGALLFKFRLKNSNTEQVRFWHIVLIIGFGAYFGSKIYYLFEEPRLFLAHPVEVIFSFNGSGWFGGFLGCLLLLYIYIHKKEMTFMQLLNLLAPSIPLGIIFGRFACFMAGDGCYGIPTDLPWGMSFPNGTLPTLLKVHPTQLYEILANAIILWVLLRIEKHSFARKHLFAFYLLMGSPVRFGVEFIRLNPILWGGLTAPQLISTGLFLWAGIYLMYHRYPLPAFLPRKLLQAIKTLL
ncbi:MAG: hypothetical protein D6748_10595 [Calditrichaeota bacterium]|nr:MAG: hypothetical protein D6748_10595 [Calditrichota bacterium]